MPGWLTQKPRTVFLCQSCVLTDGDTPHSTKQPIGCLCGAVFEVQEVGGGAVTCPRKLQSIQRVSFFVSSIVRYGRYWHTSLPAMKLELWTIFLHLSRFLHPCNGAGGMVQMLRINYGDEDVIANGDDTDDQRLVETTVFELAGCDEAGLLGRVTEQLTMQGCDVRSAAVCLSIPISACMHAWHLFCR